MSTAHNRANLEDVAKVVLMPGDPLRAKLIAENFLENPVLFNDVRGMLGYTGTYKGKRVSVMGSGMGMVMSRKMMNRKIRKNREMNGFTKFIFREAYESMVRQS